MSTHVKKNRNHANSHGEAVVDFRVIAAVIFRTDLITDDAALAKVDIELARQAGDDADAPVDQ